MNLFMHNLTQFKVEVGDTLKDPRFTNPDGSVKQFDVIVANPPYSLKWKPWTTDPRARGGVAPQSTADWAFVQHMIASMDPEKGRAGVVLPNGVLFRGGQEGAIRQWVIDEDLLEAVIGLPANLFYNTTIPTCILVFRARGTKIDERKNGVLFIDASKRFAKGKNRNVLTKGDVATTVAAYHSLLEPDGTVRAHDGSDAPVAQFVPTSEIAANGYDLNISRYIKQVTTEPSVSRLSSTCSPRSRAPALRASMTEPAGSTQEGWGRAPLSRFLTPNVEVIDVDPHQTYPTVGVLNRGRGLLYRDPVRGSSTAYKKLNRIGQGVVVYSRLKAFEGAI
ncbi:N-6 DNA methylase, partial [Corynebacterium xerosis]|uniref:N-6 DNA methylase n=1 Tax=Corynebacterium xerosis TaxID=1725 RepID=UPI00364E4397